MFLNHNSSWSIKVKHNHPAIFNTESVANAFLFHNQLWKNDELYNLEEAQCQNPDGHPPVRLPGGLL